MDRDRIVWTARPPRAAEYNALREAVGWGTMPLEVVRRSLRRTMFAVSARAGGALVASGRVVGDGGLCFYVQDVMVRPDHQRRGLGTEVVQRLMAEIGGRAVRNTYVGLMAAKGLDAFYARFGFAVRPNERLGPGMTLFWGRAGETAEP